tara:strand:+ start:285 stop:539 length:255 start_codon:yes stop_codon:yes gene_type:complete
MSKKNSTYNDAKELEKMHKWETAGKGYDPEPSEGLSDVAMEYLTQIKELQEQKAQQVLAIQTLDMAILGYSHALQDELGGNKET